MGVEALFSHTVSRRTKIIRAVMHVPITTPKSCSSQGTISVPRKFCHCLFDKSIKFIFNRKSSFSSKTFPSATLERPISITVMGILSPPTPPSRALMDDERRFEPISLPCEWVEDYRPGGYHPVILGDVFNHWRRLLLNGLARP